MPLSCSDQKQILLYRLFEWASRPRSSLALLGIANSIDLTDRFLPRLRQKLRELADVNRDESAQSCLPEPELLLLGGQSALMQSLRVGCGTEAVGEKGAFETRLVGAAVDFGREDGGAAGAGLLWTTQISKF